MPRTVMRVAPRVWKEIADRDWEPEFTLLIAGGSSTSRVEAVRAVIERASAAVGPTIDASEDGWVGRFTSVALPLGVGIAVSEDPPDLEGFVRALAVELSRVGIGGTLELLSDVQERGSPALRRANASLLEKGVCFECRLRLRGEPTPADNRPRWTATPQVFRAGIERALPFVFGEGASERFMFVEQDWFRFRPQDDASVYALRAARDARDGAYVILCGLHGGFYRATALDPDKGRITLVEAGHEAHTWREPLASLRRELVAAADDIVYGFVKRGTNPLLAASGVSLQYDWPPPPVVATARLSPLCRSPRGPPTPRRVRHPSPRKRV